MHLFLSSETSDVKHVSAVRSNDDIIKARSCFKIHGIRNYMDLRARNTCADRLSCGGLIQCNHSRGRPGDSRKEYPQQPVSSHEADVAVRAAASDPDNKRDSQHSRQKQTDKSRLSK